MVDLLRNRTVPVSGPLRPITNQVSVYSTDQGMYAVTSPSLPCVLFGTMATLEAMGIVDTGSEINVVPIGRIRELGIPMDKRDVWTMNDANGGSQPLHGVIHNFRMSVLGINFDNVRMFVTNADEGPIILGQPFIKLSRMILQTLPSGGQEVTIKSTDGDQEITYEAVPPRAHRDRHKYRTTNVPGIQFSSVSPEVSSRSVHYHAVAKFAHDDKALTPPPEEEFSSLDLNEIRRIQQIVPSIDEFDSLEYDAHDDQDEEWESYQFQPKDDEVDIDWPEYTSDGRRVVKRIDPQRGEFDPIYLDHCEVQPYWKAKEFRYDSEGNLTPWEFRRNGEYVLYLEKETGKTKRGVIVERYKNGYLEILILGENFERDTYTVINEKRQLIWSGGDPNNSDVNQDPRDVCIRPDTPILCQSFLGQDSTDNASTSMPDIQDDESNSPISSSKSADEFQTYTTCVSDPPVREQTDDIIQTIKPGEEIVMLMDRIEEIPPPEIRSFPAKYKPVAKKVRPQAVPLPVNHEKLRTYEMEHIEFLQNQDRVCPGPRLTEERLAKIPIGKFLSTNEQNLLLSVLRKHDRVFSFTEEERGRLNPSIIPPIRIPTVTHVPWKHKTRRLNPKDEEEIVEFLRTKIKAGVMEPSNGPYASRWFVIRKKNGKLRFIQDVQPLNAITIRDACDPPSAEHFSEKFGGSSIYTSFDLFSGYDQVVIDVRDRDLTAINTPLGLYRMICLPQGWTNSVAAFVAAGRSILADFIPRPADIFIDDVVVQGAPAHSADFSEISPGIRRFVSDHIETLDKILSALKESGLTIAGHKTFLCMEELTVVGYLCNRYGRTIDDDKINQLRSWPTPTDLTGVRSFLAFAKAFRMMIPNFSSRCEALNLLTRKGEPFRWEQAQNDAFIDIVQTLVKKPIIAAPDYSDLENRPFIVSTDACDTGAGASLTQINSSGNRVAIRFYSSTFPERVRRYSTIKQETLACKLALEQFYPYIRGTRFILEVDSRVLFCWLTGEYPNDTVMARWVSYIRSFDFKVVHLPTAKNVLPDVLSRTPFPLSDIDADVSTITIQTFAVQKSIPFNIDRYTGHGDFFKNIGLYLSSGSIPDSVPQRDHSKFLNKARKFILRNGDLFSKPLRLYQAPRLLVLDKATQREIISYFHEGLAGGHVGLRGTLDKICMHYWWPNITKDVKETISTCHECQVVSKKRHREPYLATASPSVLYKVHIDCVKMPRGNKGYTAFVNIRDDFSGFVDGEPIRSVNSESVRNFLSRYFGRYGTPYMLVIDGGSEFRGCVTKFLETFHVKVVTTSAYHPESNGVVERGHQPLRKALLAWLGDKSMRKWPQYLPYAFWAHNITVRGTTGYTSFYLFFGRIPVLPTNFSDRSWTSLTWSQPMTTHDLLINRIAQLTQLDVDS